MAMRIEAEAARAFAKSLLKLSPAKLAALPGVPARRARTLPAAAFVLDRVLKRLAPERVVFSALGLREGLIYSQLERRRALSRSAGRGRATRRPAAGARAAIRAGAGALDGERFSRAKARARRGCASRSARSPTSSGAIRRKCGIPRVFGACCSFRSSASTTPSGRFSPPRIHFRYAGQPNAPWLQPAISLLSPASAGARKSSGRALLLAYRISGGVPAILDERAARDRRPTR